MYRFVLFLVSIIGIELPTSFSTEPHPFQVDGVFPEMTTIGEHPGEISEAAFGALVPWANRLWTISYVSHIRGSGTGLFSLDEDFVWRKHPESVVGTYANRFVHIPSGQAIIGPHIIDMKGHVRTIEAIKGYRLTATCAHLTEPETKIYILGMEGHLWEVDVKTLDATLLFNLRDVLDLPRTVNPHFKGMFSARGRVVVANNTYHEPEHLGTRQGGRLAEWDGEIWTVLDRNPYVEVYGKGPRGGAYGDPIFAIGWDRASVILKLLATNGWQTYRLPKGSHSFDHAWNTEWFRIREAQTERFLMDAHGIFYELPCQVYEGKTWGIKPISYHLRMVPDFCFYRGLFVMAGNQTDVAVGQAQSGLWFGDIDDLFSFGKPQGWGGPWWESDVDAHAPSDAFLMTGFDRKCVHLRHDRDEPVTFTIEVDFLGNGTWSTYDRVVVDENGYAFHAFPDAFSAHWVRVSVDKACITSVQFVYS